MKSNKDLFKQAIAEAKTVREAAIANAKEALEESLTPHLKEMLSKKLQEMEGEEDDEDLETGLEGGLEAGEEGLEAGEEGLEAGEEEELDLSNMSLEDLKSVIRDMIASEEGDDLEGDNLEGDNLEGDDLEGDDLEGDDEEIDLDELLSELAGETSENLRPGYGVKDFGPMEDNPIGKAILTIVKAAKEAGMSVAQFLQKEGGAELEENLRPGYGVKDFGPMEDNPIGRAMLAVAKAAKKAGKSIADFIDDYAHTGGEMEENLRPGYGVKDFGPMEDNPIGKAMLTIAKAAKKAGMSVAEFVRQQGQSDSEMNEAVKTVKLLKGKLNEANVLNAKLLYLTKVLKDKNLSESRKVSIVAAFDKATTIKEAKLIYSTVADSLQEGEAKNSKKRHLKEARMALAKRGTKSPKKRKPEILSEQAKIVQRWQELAQIKKK